MIYWLTLFCFFNHVKLIDSMLPQVYTVIYHSSRRQNVISALLKKWKRAECIVESYKRAGIFKSTREVRRSAEHFIKLVINV